MISFNQTCTYLLPADKVSFRLHKPPSTWASSLHHRHPLPYWSFPSAYGQAKIAPHPDKSQISSCRGSFIPPSPLLILCFSPYSPSQGQSPALLLRVLTSCPLLSPAPHGLIPPLELPAQFPLPTPEETGPVGYHCSTWDPCHSLLKVFHFFFGSWDCLPLVLFLLFYFFKTNKPLEISKSVGICLLGHLH